MSTRTFFKYRRNSQKDPPTYKDSKNKGPITTLDYIYITNFANTTIKECQQFDKYNDHIYKNHQDFFMDLKKRIGNRPIELNYSYKPPRKPNNFENYNVWLEMKKRVDAIQQTSATIYLLNRGYQIITKKFPESQYQYNTDMTIEPYQIIQKALEISKKNNESYLNSLNSQSTSQPQSQTQPHPQPKSNSQFQQQPQQQSQPQYYPQYQIDNTLCYNKPQNNIEYKRMTENVNRYSCPGEIDFTLPNYPSAPNYQYSDNTNSTNSTNSS